MMLRVQLEIQFWPLATRVYLISAHCVLIRPKPRFTLLR